LKPAYLLKSKIIEAYFMREEHQKIFSVIAGDTKGKYYLLVGEHGTGKTQLVLGLWIS
jgi:MoxR-like ATPase